MKPLRADDIFEGVVAYLDHEILNARRDVSRPPSLVTRTGPFLCIEADDTRSCWIELTSKPGRDRLEIPAACRKGGSRRWRAGALFVHDPKSTYVGPHAAFVAAAANEHTDTGFDRPEVTFEMTTAVLREVADAHGARLGGRGFATRSGLPVSTFRGSSPFRGLARAAGRQSGVQRPGRGPTSRGPVGCRLELEGAG